MIFPTLITASSRLRCLLVLFILASAMTLGATYHYLFSIRGSHNSSPKFPANTDTMAPKLPLTHVEELSSLNAVHPVSTDITTTIFMFRGDFSSPLFDLFTLQKRAVKFCDKDTKAEGCDVRLKETYKWGTLSSKLVDSLDVMCNSMKRTDFYVKIDDDLIMPESRLDEIIRKMASTDCQVAGGVSVDYPFYWPVGQIYIFKRAILDDICQKLPTATKLHAHEDIAFGMLINSADKRMFCSLDKPTNHWHKNYNDQRVQIDYLQQHNE